MSFCMPTSETLNALKDPRSVFSGFKMTNSGYCDQPYVAIADDGTWVCVMTTGAGEEGGPGQHVVSTTSKDQGKTWSDPVDVEPPVAPESSWATPLKTPYGRIYVFYTYNGDNLRQLLTDPGYEALGSRVDTVGYMAFKYSDDNGASWSKDRYYVPMRDFIIDKENPYGGKVKFFWSVAKPLALPDGSMILPFSKIASVGETFIPRSEGAFLKSDNILTERDVTKLRWETLPDGEVGLKAPVGPIAEEHNATVLSTGRLYCTYRTTGGSSSHAYSDDGGHTWTPPAFMTYSPGGRRIKHTRAANFVRKFSNGKFIYWFHNNGWDFSKDLYRSYWDREVVWMCGGIEKDNHIYWSQPEIVLYDDGVTMGISYPDFVEDDGKYYITETQKTFARVHQVDNRVFEDMWAQLEGGKGEVGREGLMLEPAKSDLEKGASIELPELPNFWEREGLSFDLWVKLDKPVFGRLLDSRDERGRGFCLSCTDRGAVRLVLNDARSESAWECESGKVKDGGLHHIVVVVDGGPKTVSMIIDGLLCDGGDEKQFGWGHFNHDLWDINNPKRSMTVCAGGIQSLRLYGRYLRTAEAVSRYRAGL